MRFLGDRLTVEVTTPQERCSVVGRAICNTRAFIIEESAQQPLLIGQCTMPRWPAGVEARARVQQQRLSIHRDGVVYPVYEDLYVLHRALSHALDRYETNEVPRLTTALEYCRMLHSVVLGLRKENFQELIGHIEALVDQVVQAIGLQVRNEEKYEALKQVIVTRKGVDSLDKVNSGASCLRMLSAVGGFIRRESEVGSIAEVYAGRRQAVRLVLAMLETQVLILEDFLEQTIEHWSTVRLRRRELTAAQLNHFADALATVSVKPFSFTFTHVIREFTAAVGHIRSGRLDQARALLCTSRASLRLRRLRVQLEAVHYRVASATHDPLLRTRAVEIAHAAQVELVPIVEELRAVRTFGMVDFSSDTTLATLASVQAALAHGNCVAAAENFRLALRAI